MADEEFFDPASGAPMTRPDVPADSAANKKPIDPTTLDVHKDPIAYDDFGNPIAAQGMDPFTPLTPGQELAERERLNYAAAARGQLAGSSTVARAKAQAALPTPGPDVPKDVVEGAGGFPFEYGGKTYIPPEEKQRSLDHLETVQADILAYNEMKPFSGFVEAGASLMGQFRGALTSPESLVNPELKIGTAAFMARNPVFSAIMGQGLGQAFVNAAADPLVQANEVKASLRKEYDFVDTLTAFPVGFALGAGPPAAFHGLSKVFKGSMDRFMGRGSADLSPELKPPVDPAATSVKVEPEFAEGATGTATTLYGKDGQPTEFTRPEPAVSNGFTRIYHEDKPGTTDGQNVSFTTKPVEGTTSYIDLPEQIVNTVREGDSVSLPREVARQRQELPAVAKPEDVAARIAARNEIEARAKEKITTEAPPTGPVQSLTDFVKSKGGLEPTGEALQITGGKKRRGFVHDKGISADHMLEAAEEAGYFPKGTRQQADGISKLFNKLDDETKGINHYPEGQGPPRKADVRMQEAEGHVYAEMQSLGHDPTAPGEREAFRNAANMVYRDGFSPEDAVEKALTQAGEKSRRARTSTTPEEDLPFTRMKETAEGSPAPSSHEQILREDFIGPRSPGQVAIANMRGIMRQIAKALGIEIRQGVHVRGALGTLEGKLVRLIDSGDLITFVHEVGHRVEEKIGPPMTALITRFDHTMRAFAPGAEGDPAHIVREGFGEFMGTYMSEREAAVRVDPNFVREFRNLMESTEEGKKLLDVIDKGYLAYRAYQNAPGTQIATSMISTTAGAKAIKEADPMQRGAVRAWFAQKQGRWINEQAPLNQVVNYLLKQFMKENKGKQYDLTPEFDPRVQFQILRHGAHSRSAQEMHSGIVTDKTFQTVSPSIVKIVDRVTSDPVTGAVAPDAATMASRKRDFAAYLVAVWHLELRKQIDQGLLDLRRPPTGMTNNTAATTVKAMEAKYPMFQSLAEEVYAYNKALVKKEVDAGLRDVDSYKNFMKEENHKYVPTHRDMASPTGKTTGIGTAMRHGLEELNRRARTGSTRNIMDPIDSLMDRHFLINEQINYNKAVLILRDFVRNVGGDEGGRFVTEIPNHQMRVTDIDVRRVIEKGLTDQGYNAMDAKDIATMHLAELNMEGKVRLFQAAEIKGGGRPVIFGMEGGERFALELPNNDFGKDFFHAVDFLGTVGAQNVSQAAGLLHSILVPSAKSLRAGAVTTFTFAVKNMIRDAFGSFIYINGVKAPLETIIRGAWQLGKHRLSQTDVGQRWGISESDIVKAYRDLGGLEGGAVTSAMTQEGRGIGARKELYGWQRFDVARAERAMQRAAAGEEVSGLKLFTEALGDARRILGDGLRNLAKVAEFTELANRVGIFDVVYKQNKKMGRSEEFAMVDAAQKARDFVDFSMHGSRSELLAQTVPFLNASVQGANKYFRVLNQATFKKALTPFEQAEKTSLQKQLLVKVSAVAAFTMFNEYLHQDDPWYQNLPEQRKTQYWNFKVLGQEVAVPKPFEWASLLNLAEYAMRYVNTGDEQHMINWVKSAKYTFNFPSGNPLLSTAFGLASNYDDFFNRPIVPDRLRHLEPYLQRYNDTGKIYIAIAKMLRGSEGVRDYLRKDIPLISPTIGGILASAWSPAEAEFMVSRMLGDWPRELGGIDGITKSLTTGDNRTMENIPVLRSLLPSKVSMGEATREIINQTNQTDGRLTRAKASYESERKNDPTGQAAQFVFDNLDNAQKEYVRLGFIEGGAVVNAMHPMIRSKQIYTAVARITNQMESETGLKSYANGQSIDVPIGDRRTIVNLLNEYTANQARNTLIMMGIPGYKGQAITPTQPDLEKLKAISPAVYKELSTELAERHVLPLESVQQYWPQVQTLIAGGGNARALSVQAKALGIAAQSKGMEGGGIAVGRGAVSIEGEYVKKEKQKPTTVPATQGVSP